MAKELFMYGLQVMEADMVITVIAMGTQEVYILYR
jgi:hypothetical protein